MTFPTTFLFIYKFLGSYSNSLLFLLLGAFFYAGLGVYGLLNNNEGLYAEIAWEMLSRGDYVWPHLNGVPYIEKPPLLYWLIALCLKMGGKTEFMARFVPATFGFLSCISLWWFGSTLRLKKWGKIAAIILASSCGFIIFSRIIFFESGLTICTTLCAMFFYKFYETHHKKYLRLFYALLAMGLLMKGFVILILMTLIIFVFCFIEKRITFIYKLLDPLGISLFVIIALPWHVMAWQRDSGFAWFYFINEQVLRFLDARLPRDYFRGPVYYYVPRVLGYMIPWTFILPFLNYKKNDLPVSLNKFLWVWFLGLFLFFSISRAKANYYMMGAIPPLALLMASYLIQIKYWKRVLVINVLISSFLVGGGLIYLHTYEERYSMRKAIHALNLKTKKVFLFRCFEDLSSITFYMGQPIPIVDSHSNDLLYGQNTCPSSPFFVNQEALKPGDIILVRENEEKNFRIQFKNKFILLPYENTPYKFFIIQ